jgi:hypothetical protein
MISHASDTGTRGACADTGTAGSGAGRNPDPGCSGTPPRRARADTRRAGSDARGARADTRRASSDARRDPDPRCSGTPSGRNADSFSADADTGINGKGNCGEHQRAPTTTMEASLTIISVPSISTRAAPSPMETRHEQARSRV